MIDRRITGLVFVLQILLCGWSRPAVAERATIPLNGTWSIAESIGPEEILTHFDHTVAVPGLVNQARPAFAGVDQYQTWEFIWDAAFWNSYPKPPPAAAELPPGEGPEDDYRRLCNELMRVMLAKELFTFVTAEPVEKPNGETLAVPGTNNESERTLRSVAEARNTGRTNKTVRGARRRTVIVSVLESLRQHLSSFTLSGVIAEVRRWSEAGRSCFARLAQRLGLTAADASADGRPSLLDRLLPVPDG